MIIDRGVTSGTLLVASPTMTSDYFSRSVVLISEKTDRGHVGYVINKKTIAEVNAAVQNHGLVWPWQDFMFEGGPVNRSAMIMIHSPEWASSNTMRVGSAVCAISSDKLMFEKMIQFDVPINRMFLIGQSVWLPGQLEREIKHNKSWLTTPATSAILWDVEGEDQWTAAIDLCATNAMNHYFA